MSHCIAIRPLRRLIAQASLSYLVNLSQIVACVYAVSLVMSDSLWPPGL